MESMFVSMFAVATAVKVLLIPAYFSTDFEVHRNWLAITHSLPINQWYVDATSQWTLDYPPCFAYFEWLLSQVAQFVDPKMLNVNNHNYASDATIYFQRGSVMCTDVVYALGVWRCLKALKISEKSQQHFAAEVLLLLNLGLIFVDHIHFQYNGMLFGLLLLSISFLLKEQFLKAAFTFALLLNFKHIFLYIAPAFAIYLLKFYCLGAKRNVWNCMLKLLAVGLTPFALAFAPFWQQLPQVFARLFPFKRGLTHAYWAPNFWAIYNFVDKLAAQAMGKSNGPSTTAGLVQEFEHQVLPKITPAMTFLLTLLFMLPVLVKLLCFTKKSESPVVFLRAVVLCACASFMFGWHVHEKAILMCLIPLYLLALLKLKDAKYAYVLSFTGYFSLFPLLFDIELWVVRYSLFCAFMSVMYGQLSRIFKWELRFNIFEKLYFIGFVFLPIYEHILSPWTSLCTKFPYMPLLLTSLYCSLGVVYFFVCYYWLTLELRLNLSSAHVKTKTSFVSSKKAKLKQKLR